MEYTICICDDSRNVRNDLAEYVLQYCFQNNIDISTFQLESAHELLTCTRPYDILLLDIRFKKENIGIQVAEKLRNKGNTSIIVIITSYESMAIDGYRAEPYRFIVKPFTQYQIFDLLNDCFHKLTRTVNYIKIISDSLSEQIRVDKILYIYSKARKRHVVCSDGVVSTWQNLQELMEHLPAEKFAFAQKSFIVNLNMVETIRNESIILSNEKSIPIGNHYKDEFMRKLQMCIKLR